MFLLDTRGQSLRYASTYPAFDSHFYPRSRYFLHQIRCTMQLRLLTCEATSSLRSSPIQNPSSALCAHPRSKAVLLCALPFIWLISSFHSDSFINLAWSISSNSPFVVTRDESTACGKPVALSVDPRHRPISHGSRIVFELFPRFAEYALHRAFVLRIR